MSVKMGGMGRIGVDKKQHTVKMRQLCLFKAQKVYETATISVVGG